MGLKQKWVPREFKLARKRRSKTEELKALNVGLKETCLKIMMDYIYKQKDTKDGK